MLKGVGMTAIATEKMTDRIANSRELAAARRRLLTRNSGPGYDRAAKRLGMSAGHLYKALHELVSPASRLRLSQLRAMFEAEGEQ